MKLVKEYLYDPIKFINYVLIFFSKYIAKILYEFTDFESSVPIFKDEQYYNNVYKHNCDVWGFIMSYSPLIRNNYFRNEVKNALSLKYYIKNTCDLLLKYCFNSYYSTKKINQLGYKFTLNSYRTIKKTIDGFRK